MKTLPPLPEAPRICIVLLTGLGDVVMGLPLVNAIKRARPEAHITWVVEPMPSAVLAPHPAIDRVVVFEKQRGWRGVVQLRRELARERFDLTINLNIYFKSAWPTLLSRAPVRLGFERGRAKDLTWLATNIHPPRRSRQHTLDMFLEFATLLGIAAEPLQFGLQITPAERAAQRSFIDSRLGGERYVAVVPASANRNKDWIPSRMAEVADRIFEEHGLRSVLIGGPGARERALAQEIEGAAKHPIVNAMGDGVRRLLWLIEGADLLISPDSGPVHIARALAKPVVGLYGHTNPWRVGPYRWCTSAWVDAYTDGEPDPANFEPKGGRMASITAAMVVERASGVLAGPLNSF